MRLIDGIQVFGQHEANTLAQLSDVASRAERAALMADGHLGYIMPVGGVAAYDGRVSVAGVGFDIACGNAAIRTDLDASDVMPRRGEIAKTIADTVSFGMGRTNKADDAPTDDLLFDELAWELIPREWRTSLKAKARNQLGTVGSGNHYVDVFADEADRVWVGVHFGSRGLGHTIASGFMALAQGLPWDHRGKEVEALLPVDSHGLGGDYWELMELAGRYAYAGREWVARKVVRLLGGNEMELVHNHHNFAWKERHFGKDLVVVRKGATPAFPGQKGFIGGSMGDDAVIVEGEDVGDESRAVDAEMQAASMFSTVHGAGRVMSRTAAAGKTRTQRLWTCGMRECDGQRPLDAPMGEGGANPRCPKCDGKMHKNLVRTRIKEGLVSQAMMDEWMAGRDVVLEGGGLDESPHAYRRLPDVLREHAGTISVLHTLRPLVVVMAGADVVDPYRD